MKTFFIALFTSILVTVLFNYLLVTNIIDITKFTPGAKNNQIKKEIEIQMPNFNNLNMEEGTLVCMNLGLVLIFEELENKNFITGRVFKQFPLPGYKVKKGDSVRLTIAKETVIVQTIDDKITIPDIIGQTYDEGVKILKEIGLKNISREDQFSEKVKIGKIIYVNPDINEKVKSLSKIQLFVSSGKAIKFTTVPNVLGKDYTRALNILNSAGLKLGKIFKVTDEDKGFDRVIKQNYIPGKKVKLGTRINITLNVERGDL